MRFAVLVVSCVLVAVSCGSRPPDVVDARNDGEVQSIPPTTTITTISMTSTTVTSEEPLTWPPDASNPCTETSYRFVVPVGWFASLERAPQCSRWPLLTNKLRVTDVPVPGKPGFFLPGASEADAYAVWVHEAAAGTSVANLVGTRVKRYLNADATVEISEQGATLVPEVPNVEIRRVTNRAGLVGIRFQFVVAIAHDFGGAPRPGSTMTLVAVELPDRRVLVIEQSSDRLVTAEAAATVIDSIFATLTSTY